ncbi:hypothetical protein AGDE_17097 [Angomonas deanei]|nr:hypothetical protein AGDE_17097 [Angomonas deanei]|eukprot:EPY15486.1 hypothetical protein AGDE_17097 [Angomonas deanei]
MSADDLAVTPAASPGNLRNVTLLGNAREATLTGTITNTGNVSSAFTFAVQGCTPGGFVPNPPSVTLMMRPNTSLVYTHTLHAVTDVMEGVLICFVELTDSIGTSLDVFLQPWEYVTTTTTTTTTSTTTSTSTSTSSTSTSTSTTSTTAAPNTSTTLSPAGPGLQGCNACAITHIACLFQSRCPWPLLLWVFVIEVGLTVLWGLVYWRQSFLPCVFKRKNTTK